MIDPGLPPQDPARSEQRSGPVAADSTKTYVRLAQQRANRGEPLDGNPAPAAEGGLRGLLRRLWPRRRGG